MFDKVISQSYSFKIDFIVWKSRFLRECVKTEKHLIFIGQSPVDLDNYTGDEQPNKSIVKLNAFVNEKYRCTDNFKVETTKYRGRK